MKQSADQPNILLITCDQLRADYLGAYGADFMKTPNLDRLAREGVRFSNAYSPNPVCIPARHNLITGLPARYHGFDDNYFDGSHVCPWELPTFAQILNDHGYETAAIGKMHFMPERRATGFDFFYNMNECPPTREEDEYSMFLRERGYGGHNGIHGLRGCLYMQPQRSLLPEALHGSAWVADQSIAYLRRTRGRKPFLLWAGFIHPHPPLDVPDSWAELYRGQVPPPLAAKTPLSALAEENKGLPRLHSPAAIQRVRELYASAISFADCQIGRILAELEALGLAENTLVVFTSDHGEMLGDLGTYQKFLPYDASSKIPLLLRWPGQLKPGAVDERLVDLNDLLPTFLDAAGLSYPARYDLPGESLLTAQGRKNRAFQYIEHQHGSKRWCALRDARYKFVHYYGGDEELFDLLEDPGETTNLLYGAPDAAVLTRRDTLRAALIQYEARYGLEGYVEHGDFKTFPRYVAQPIDETFVRPSFYPMLLEEERAQMDDVLEEILRAIEKEPTTKLRENGTAEILAGAGFSPAQIEDLLRRAEAQGN